MKTLDGGIERVSLQTVFLESEYQVRFGYCRIGAGSLSGECLSWAISYPT